MWVDGPDGYSLALVDGKLQCRNKKGKTLQSVPKKVRDSEVGRRLKALSDWLVEHQRTCRETIERWMLRSLPVPREVLEQVWPDPAWRGALQHLVVAPLDGDAADIDGGGFLEAAEAGRGLGIVDLDGESGWLDSARIAVLHPILLGENLDDLRELATDLEFEQGVMQLMRETFDAPADMDPDDTSMSAWSGGKFEQLNHVLSRCQTLGYRVSGGYAVCPVWEGGRMLEARYWVGAESPEAETWTSDLIWVDDEQSSVKLGDVGPVALSEGMRMAGAIYARRVVEEDDE